MRDAHRFTHRCTQQLYHGLIHVSLPGSPETAIAHTELSPCGSTLLIRAKPLSGMVRIAHAVAAAMAVSSGLAIDDMGTTYQLQHRSVPFCSRPSYEARGVAVDEQCGSTLLIRVKPLSGMVRIAHAVAAAMAVSSGLAIADLGTTCQLHHRLVLSAVRVSTRRWCNSVPLPRALSDDSELACSATSTASTILTIPESDWAPISSLGLHWSPTRWSPNSRMAHVDVATANW